jgi:hypothetical protein
LSSLNSQMFKYLFPEGHLPAFGYGKPRHKLTLIYGNAQLHYNTNRESENSGIGSYGRRRTSNREYLYLSEIIRLYAIY